MKGLLFILIIISSLTGMGQKLKQGDLAPTFWVKDIYGTEISFTNTHEKKVLLAFMRYAGCPICNYRMHELMENYNQLKNNGFELIVIYQSSDSTLREYLKNENIAFPLIGDPDRELYKKYGVETSFGKMLGSAFQKDTYQHKKTGDKLFGSSKQKRDGSLTGIPADFLISENGKVIKAYYGKSISDHLPLKEIIK